MNQVLLEAFADELTKIAAGAWGHAAEVAGLGTLAAPHVYNAVTGKKTSHKTTRNTELAGLGILAAPSVKALLTKRANVSKLIQQGVQTLGTGRSAVLSAGKAAAKALPQAAAEPAKKLMPSGADLLKKIREAKAAYGTPAAKVVKIAHVRR